MLIKVQQRQRPPSVQYISILNTYSDCDVYFIIETKRHTSAEAYRRPHQALA